MPDKKYMSRRKRGFIKDFRVTDRHVAYMQWLYRYDFLNTQYLHALVCPQLYPSNTTIELDKLHCRPHMLVDRPSAQWDIGDPLHRPLWHQLSKKGEHYLIRQGLAHGPRPKRHSNHFAHQAFQDTFEVLALLSAHANNVPFQSKADIIEGKLELTIPASKEKLKPDNLIAVNGKHYFIEIDRATEHIGGGGVNKTWKDNITKYAAVAKSRTYTDLGISGANLLIVTVNESYMRRIMKIVSDITKGKGTGFIAFMCIPEFARTLYPPLPHYQLLQMPFDRVRHPPLYLGGE